MNAEVNASSIQGLESSVPIHAKWFDPTTHTVDQQWTSQSSTSTSLPVDLPQVVIYKYYKFQKPLSQNLDKHIKPCWSLARPVEVQMTSKEIEAKVKTIRGQSRDSPIDEYNKLASDKMQLKIDELLSTHAQRDPSYKWSIAAIETKRRKASDRNTEIGDMLVIIMGVQMSRLSVCGQFSPMSGYSPQDPGMHTLLPPINVTTQSPRESSKRAADTRTEAVPNGSQPSKSPITLLRPSHPTTEIVFPSPTTDLFQDQNYSLFSRANPRTPATALKLSSGPKRLDAESPL